ncbi:uncharacterized protein [Apostichopus japonicus]|uniref:uncharacterized protein isoform X2 n=1 Tax=Stichopus japonicus TaxID=307972 RepID=UPI003AB207E8
MGSDDGNAKKVKRKKRRSKQSRIHPSDSEASREEYTINSHGNQSLTIEEEVNDSGDSPSSSNLLIKPKKSTTPYKSSILKAAAVTSFLGNGVTKGVKATSEAGKTAAEDGMRNVMAAKRGARKFLALGKRQKQKCTSTMTGIDDPNSASMSNLSDRNKDLIGYFAGLAKSDDPDIQVDLDHIEDLVRKGANINCTDRFGQNILHEVARTWEVEIAEFLIDQGIDINQCDAYGRTPLHVAAAVDYPDMIKLLLERGADIECCTKGENQTPLHYAARNDACEALKLLVKMKANLHSRDYKQRTPLQVAAELDRSETAKLLLQLGADASDSDIAGQTALVLMITKMPAVAKLALDQFHKLDRANRLQYYDINYIEPTKPDDPEPRNKTAMSVIVQFNQLELIMHPVIQRLIDIKWRKFGKWGICKQVVLNLIFIFLWTGLAVSLDSDLRKDYFKLAISCVAVLLTISQIYLELLEFYNSKKQFKKWKEWRTNEVEKDMKFCHPRWPQEESYLLQEIKNINQQSPRYFSEFWNYFDWFIYLSLMGLAVVTTVLTFVPSLLVSRIVKNVASIVIIFVWLRSMKVMRGFRALGPFIVMLGLIVKDIAIFGFLYFEFFIPFGFAFWMTFGGGQGNVTSMATVDQLTYSLFRLTLVDEYQYDEMREVDVVMTYILCTTFLFLSAILCINLFIALLSNTFQRIYDNATSNAVMQQASIILNIEEGMPKKKRKKMRRYIHENCSPEALFYDDDVISEDGEELKLMTFQIKESLEEMQQDMAKLGVKSSLNEISTLREELNHLREEHTKSKENIQNDLSTIKDLLQTLLTLQAKGGNSVGPSGHGHDNGGGPSGGLDHDYEDPELLKSPENKPRPRFVGRRDTKMQMSLFGTNEPKPRSPYVVDATSSSAISISDAPVVEIAAPSPTLMKPDQTKRLKELRLESRARRKLRKEQEDYLQQKLSTPDESVMIPLPPKMATLQESDTESDIFSLSGRLEEDTEMESMASKVRMQPPPPMDDLTFAKTQP